MKISNCRLRVNPQSGSQTLDASNGSVNQKQGSAASPKSQFSTKQPSRTDEGI